MATQEGQVDHVSGQTTTGHAWDGIRELNTPLPRWWLYTFYATIAVAVVYWILFPSWPLITGYAPGLLGTSNRTRLAPEIAAGQAARMQLAAGLQTASLAQIESDPKLQQIALARGRAAFGDNCAPCHGSGGQGQRGYPNLTAGRWLWGGTLEQIHATIDHGIRAPDDTDTRISMMPAFGKDGILKPEEIRAVANYVRTLAGLASEKDANLAMGKKVFADNCVACHGDDGKGNIDMGSANLTTKVWQYGADLPDLIQTIAFARNSTMPSWHARLDPVTIKSLAVYVHSLGGGK